MFIKSFKSCLDNKPVNTGRQIELDIGKTIPIICLPFIHCIIECCTDTQLLSGIPYVFDTIIGGPLGAPMFLLCMGATINFSKLKAPADFTKRGITLIGIGFLLNIFRILIPSLIGYAATSDSEQFIEILPYRFFGNDVLQFAGLAIICFAIMLKLKVPKRVMFILALALSVLGTFLKGIDLGNDFLNIFGGWFIGTVNEKEMIFSDFPLLNWLIVPTVGYIFGWILRRVRDKKHFYLSFSPILLALAFAGFTFGIINGIGMFGEGQNCYYHLQTQDAFLAIAALLGLLGCYSALCYILPEWIKKFFMYTSSNITAFYCIHWVFVVMITRVIVFVATGSQYLPVWVTLLISFMIMLLTYFVLFIYRKIRPRVRGNQ